MFVTVKYGEEQSRLFNANCRNDILLQHIKKRCECSREEIIELSDENGVVKHLRNFPYDYGVEHLKERETLILLKVEVFYPDENESSAGSQSDRLMFVPLLTSMENNKEFIDSINPRPQSRKGSAQDSEERRRAKAANANKQIKPPPPKRTNSKSGPRK